jgi:hypothetical protein
MNFNPMTDAIALKKQTNGNEKTAKNKILFLNVLEPGASNIMTDIKLGMKLKKPIQINPTVKIQ